MSTTLNLAPKGGDMPRWAIFGAESAGLDLANATYNPAGEFVEFPVYYRANPDLLCQPDLLIVVSDFGAVYIRGSKEMVLVRYQDAKRCIIENQVEGFLLAAKLLKALNGAVDAISPVEVTA